MFLYPYVQCASSQCSQQETSWLLVLVRDCLDQLLNPVCCFFPSEWGVGLVLQVFCASCSTDLPRAVRSSSELMPLPTSFLNMSFIVRAVSPFLLHPLLYSLYVNIRLQQLSLFTMKSLFWCSCQWLLLCLQVCLGTEPS